MPLISETLSYANSFRKQFGLEQNETWTEISENVLVIRENGVTLEYTTMNGTTLVKQADVVLVNYPLVYDNNYTAQHSLNDLDYVRSFCFSYLVLTLNGTNHSCAYSMPTNSLLMDLL
jgi:hypothetical protein